MEKQLATKLISIKKIGIIFSILIFL